MVRVKICGISDLDTALAATEAGADALGFVFAPSRRQVEPQLARSIAQQLPPFVTKVGVFVNAQPDYVKQIAEFVGLDLVQLHGQESPQYCATMVRPVMKAISVESEIDLSALAEYRVQGFLLDAYHPHRAGGSGITFDWRLSTKVKTLAPVIIAGGLNSDNVRTAIEISAPYGVDVSSGVERAGSKDVGKIQQFISLVRRISK